MQTTPASPATGEAPPPVAQNATIPDELGAVSAISGLLDFDPDAADGETQSDAPEASDTGPDENRTPGDEEGQSEPPAEEKPAIIEPPNSWSTEEKELFRTLPSAAQQAIARRDSEQHALFTKATQEAAEHRKAIDAEREAVAAQRQTYANSLQQILQLVLPEAKALEGVDWIRLAAEQPAEYVRLIAQRDALRNRVGAIQAEQQRLQDAARADQENAHRNFLAEQTKLLYAAVADFADPVKGPKLSADVRDYLQQRYGFTAAEIASVMDHRLIRVAVDAMRAFQATQARVQAEDKRQVPVPPKIQRPGTANGSDETRGRRLDERLRRFEQTGSERDAAAVIGEMGIL